MVKVSRMLPVTIAALAVTPAAGQAPRSRTSTPVVGTIQAVHRFRGSMPTGVTVSREGRIFVNYPRWGDPVPFTVAEIRNGREVPYPDARINRYNRQHPADCFVSVQSVVVDPRDRLWVLDTGSIRFGPAPYGGPKLIGFDLRTNKPFRKIVFPRDVALPTTYLNDVRFDLTRGVSGMAFITDSSGSGPNAIIVVDLSTGRSWRRLQGHPSVRAETRFLPIVEGQQMMNRPAGRPATNLRIGADGIAISPDGKRLYYCPLASRRLYSVSVNALADRRVSNAAVARTVIDHGVKGASDGLESDSEGRVYITDYERNAIRVREVDGRIRTLAQDPRILWPDTLSVAPDGNLYFIANQLHRQPAFHRGRDMRVKPYMLFRTPIGGEPVALGSAPPTR